MINNFKFLILLNCLLPCWLSVSAAAQQKDRVYSPLADSLFESVIEYYTGNRPGNVQEIIDTIQNMPVNQRSSAAYYMNIRLALDRKKYGNARELIERFPEEFPGSRYIPHVKYLKAEMHNSRGHFIFAFEELLWIIEHSREEYLVEAAADKYLEIFDTRISESMYDDLASLYDNERIRDLNHVKKAQLKYYNNSTGDVISIVENISNNGDFSPVNKAVSELQSLIRDEMESDKYIAVLFPFNGAYSERGRSVFNGARVALQEKEALLPHKIVLKPIDTNGDISGFPALLRQLSEDKSIIGVVGPVVPELRLLANTLAPLFEIPIIIPDNIEVETNQNNDYFYQMKGSKMSEGTAIAQFAFEKLNLSTFAILSPIGRNEKDLIQNFALEVERLGGNILAHEWYFPGTVDYNMQFRQLRKTGYDLMMEDSLSIYISESIVDSATITSDSLSTDDIDSLAATFLDSLSIATLDSIWYVYLDTLATRRRNAGIRYFDTLDYSVNTFDAIFIPVTSTEDIDFIINQFAFYNFDTILLGNSAWYDPVILNRVQNNFTTLYMTADYFADDTFTPWANFRDNFRNVTGLSPGVDDMYGYESAMFLMNAIQRYPTRHRLNDNLEKIRNMPDSARGSLEMDGSHQKINWHILRFRRGRYFLENR